MSNVEHGRVRRGAWVLPAVGLVASLLVACGRAESVEVSASAPPSAPSAPSAPATESVAPDFSFQGAVTDIDLDREEVGVATRIEWMPVLKAVREERRVAVGPETSWVPAGTGLAILHVGDEVQVKAVTAPDGTWQAQEIQLFDID